MTPGYPKDRRKEEWEEPEESTEYEYDDLDGVLCNSERKQSERCTVGCEGAAEKRKCGHDVLFLIFSCWPSWESNYGRSFKYKVP